MDEKTTKEELRKEIQRDNHVRAVMIATTLGMAEDEIMDLKTRALWQIAAEYRNAHATKSLASAFGLSKTDLKSFFENQIERVKENGDIRNMDPCFHPLVDKYLAFEEWVEHLFRNWDEIRVS